MKRAKRIFAGLTALIVGVSVAAFVPACGDNPDKADVNGEIVTGDNPDNAFGNVDGNGEIVTGGNLDGNSGGEKSVLLRTMDAVVAQEIAGATFNFRMTASDRDETGKYGESVDRLDIDVKLNNDMNGDFILHDVWSSDNSVYNNYDFIRNGKFLSVTAGEQITDFTGVQMNVSDIFDEYGILDTIFPIMGMEQDKVLETDSIAVPFTIFLGLAECYGGATYENGVITVNMNKVVSRMYAEATSLINGLTDNTTVGDIYSSKVVKSLIQSCTYGLNVKEMYEAGMAEIDDAEADIPQKENIKTLPAPTEGDTYYTYLGKLLKEKKFTQVILGLTSSATVGASLVSPMYDMTIVDLVGMFMSSEGSDVTFTAEQVRETINGVLAGVTVTEEKIAISIDNSSMELSNVKTMFTVDGNSNITDFAATACMVNTYSNGGVKMDVTIGVRFLKEPNTLTDISGAKCVEEVKSKSEDEIVIDDGTYYASVGYVGYDAYYFIEIQDNAVTGIYSTTALGGEKGDPLLVNKEDIEMYVSLVLTYDDWVYLQIGSHWNEYPLYTVIPASQLQA